MLVAGMLIVVARPNALPILAFVLGCYVITHLVVIAIVAAHMLLARKVGWRLVRAAGYSEHDSPELSNTRAWRRPPQ